jgi:hypothetical protein
MGREVRKVPADWQHPKNDSGNYKPLYGRDYERELAVWNAENEQWQNGLRKDFETGGYKSLEPDEVGKSYSEWNGDQPKRCDYMPSFPESERTHWQMYENTSEGTPISPVMESPEALAQWLADNNASSFGHMTATKEQWLHTILGGSAPSMVICGGVARSGVEAISPKTK